MAVDSIIARPTNRVRVMVAEASGCWASEVSAVATARPSASAGPIVPKPVVIPAMAMEATAIIVMLSINPPGWVGVNASLGGPGRNPGFSDPRGGCDIDRRQNGENVG